MARETKMNKERRDGILKLLRNGQTITFACEAMNVSRQREWEERRDNEEYRNQVNDALMRRAEMVEDALYAKAISGDVAAQRLFLINRAPVRWKSEHWAGLQVESRGRLGCDRSGTSPCSTGRWPIRKRGR